MNGWMNFLSVYVCVIDKIDTIEKEVILWTGMTSFLWVSACGQ